MPFLLLKYKNHNHNTNIQNHIIQYTITKFPLININTYSFIHIHIHNNSRIQKFIYIYIYIQIHAITKQTVINSCHTTQLHIQFKLSHSIITITQLHIQFKLSHSIITHLSWLWSKFTGCSEETPWCAFFLD